MARITKKDIYAKHGIEYDAKQGKIRAPIFGWIRPLLINGNSKLGDGVFTFSTLAGTREYTFEHDGKEFRACGTCPCDCKGCYAQTGFFTTPDVIASNGRKTILARDYPQFVESAIIAQIEAEGVKLLRVHASGDFFSAEYVNLWRAVRLACPSVQYWTYTKYGDAESAFDDLDGFNVVKSKIRGIGVNFGHCDYVMRAYETLRASGANVHICRCGIDKNQHCNNCKGCANNDYVLFVEHSTDYVAEEDASFPALRDIIDAQPKQ